MLLSFVMFDALKPLRVQRYNKFLIYANLFTKYSRTRIKLREKDEETRSPKERAQDTYLAGHRQALNRRKCRFLLQKEEILQFYSQKFVYE